MLGESGSQTGLVVSFLPFSSVVHTQGKCALGVAVESRSGSSCGSGSRKSVCAQPVGGATVGTIVTAHNKALRTVCNLGIGDCSTVVAQLLKLTQTLKITQTLIVCG